MYIRIINTESIMNNLNEIGAGGGNINTSGIDMRYW